MCICTFKTIYALGLKTFLQVVKRKQLWLYTQWHSDSDTPNSLLITSQSPSSHTDRLFQHLSPWLLCKIQLKITNLEKQSMNEACGFVGAEPSLAPSWFWVPCSVAVTLQSWATVTSLNKAPLSQISSFAT